MTATLSQITVPARPGEPAAALPGDELVAVGTAFGASPDNQAAVLVTPDTGTAVAAPIVAWSDRLIRFTVPAGLGGPGPKQVRVRNRQGTSGAQTFAAEGEPALPYAPVALLPLGLQTRFMNSGRELWVRALPDIVHVDSHDPRLTTDEAALGAVYRDAAGAARDDAWLELTTRFGAPRAEWIVRTVLAGAVTTRTEVWARGARTRLLPRRLYAAAYDDAGTLIAAQYGRPIPFEMPIGPDPAATTDPVQDPGMAWLVDFPAAVGRGMGIKLTLPDPPPARIARLVVLGVETGQSAQDGAREFGDLLAAHRYTRGIGFLPEGTATNVTPSAPTDPGPVGADRPAGAPVAPAVDGNAEAAAGALGLTARAAELFGGIPHADDGVTLRRARRGLNAALWPATWGYFLRHMLDPVVSEEQIEAGRAHFTDWVRGSGPQPILRLGTMPYGLLPVLPAQRFAMDDEPAPVAALHGFLRDTLRPVWSASSAAVPRVTDVPQPGQSENPLLTVLSMQPTSISFRGRTVLGIPFVDAAWRFIRNRLTTSELLDPAWHARQTALARAALEAHGLGDWHPYVEKTVFAANYFPITLPLVQDGGDRDAALAVDWLSVLRQADWRSLRQDAFALPGLDQRPLLYLMLRHSLLVQYLFAAGALAPADPWRGGEPIVYGIDEVDDNLAAPRPGMVWDRLTTASATGQAKGDLLDTQPVASLAAVRDGIATLAGTPVGLLEQAAAETLDLSSHRLDAWLTSFAQRRLHRIRAADPGGLHIGGYGIVEDLVPGSGSGSAGYVHTPSVSHARAAAILASGFRSHPDGGGTRAPFGIDLSSERVRAALGLLDGVRAGQPLGALLGYRFERTLQERGLARFIDDFRTLAPAPVAGTAPDGETVHAVGKQNVADALELHRQWVAAGRRLPAGWPGSSSQPAVQSVFEQLDDGVDALGDIFLTEGVYQLGRGNADRAAAALQAAARPGGAVPELEAVYTPHSGTAVIHRLAMLLPGNAATADGWNTVPTQLRRAAEPRLDAWAGRLLGDPDRIRYRIRYRRAGTGQTLSEQERRLDQLTPALSPLDVLAASVAADRSQQSELEQRILYHAARNRPPGVPADATVTILDAGTDDDTIGLPALAVLAESLREILGSARPVLPDDLALPDKPGSAVLDVTEIEARAAAARNALAAAGTALDAAITAPTGEKLRTALLGAAGLGIPGTVPLSPFGDSTDDRSVLITQADVVRTELRRRLAAADHPDPGARADVATARIRSVFGDLRVVPRLSAPPTGDPAQVDVRFNTSAGLLDGDTFAAVRWFQRQARVRDGARRLGDALLYADAAGGADAMNLRVAQLPAVQGDRWIGLPFEDGVPPAGRVSIVGYLPLGPLNQNGAVCGLLIEELTEVLPAPAKTTGLALHYDQPDAAPPQAIVLAVPPRPGQEWTLAALRDVVADTLELAKIRMVDLDALDQAGHFVPATYLGYNAKGVTVGTDFLVGRGAPLG